MVNALAIESGATTLSDGRALEVGRVRADTRAKEVQFDGSFSNRPVVLSQTQTVNGHQPVVTRNADTTTRGFSVRLQEEEAEGYHKHETVGYLAVEPGTGDLGGATSEVNTVDSVDHQWTEIQFANQYGRPVFLADVQTTNGPDTCTVRYRNLTGSSVEVLVEEERSEDSEKGHTGERVGYLVVEGTSNELLVGYGSGEYGQTEYGA